MNDIPRGFLIVSISGGTVLSSSVCPEDPEKQEQADPQDQELDLGLQTVEGTEVPAKPLHKYDIQ